MAPVIEPEVIPNGRKVRIQQSKRGTVPYIDKKELAAELNRSRTTLSQWEELLIKYSPDFRKFYTPGSPWNDFQAFCLELIHNWRESIKTRKLPPKAYQQFIIGNAQLFTLENYKNELKTQYTTEQIIQQCRIIEAA